MALKHTMGTMKKLMCDLQYELEKCEAGNKAAAQRARKCTLHLAKVSKMFRKESIKAFKGGKAKKRKKRR